MKPSYEELEEQLNRSRRLCDAALANERVWETAMMEACGEDGPASVAAEIKALRAQRDTAMESLRQQLSALAAENALLKKSEPAPFSKLMMEALDVYQAGADEVPELAMLIAYKKLRDGLKTPATDAFLAEVRASAITDALKSLDVVFDTDCVMESNGISYEDAEQRTAGAYAVSKALEDFAAQIRKGVRS